MAVRLTASCSAAAGDAQVRAGDVGRLVGQQIQHAVGNLIGSSVYNILLILGVTSVVPIGDIPVPPELAFVDIPVMVAATLACIPVFISHRMVTRLEAQLASDPATAARVAAIVEAQSSCRVAMAELQTVATRLDFTPRGDAGVRVGGAPHAPGRPLHVSERVEIELDGFGSIVVQPGAGDVERRRASLALVAVVAVVAAVAVVAVVAWPRPELEQHVRGLPLDRRTQRLRPRARQLRHDVG